MKEYHRDKGFASNCEILAHMLPGPLLFIYKFTNYILDLGAQVIELMNLI